MAQVLLQKIYGIYSKPQQQNKLTSLSNNLLSLLKVSDMYFSNNLVSFINNWNLFQQIKFDGNYTIGKEEQTSNSLLDKLQKQYENSAAQTIERRIENIEQRIEAITEPYRNWIPVKAKITMKITGSSFRNATGKSEYSNIIGSGGINVYFYAKYPNEYFGFDDLYMLRNSAPIEINIGSTRYSYNVKHAASRLNNFIDVVNTLIIEPDYSKDTK